MQKDSVKYWFAHGYSLVTYSPPRKQAAHFEPMADSQSV
jgi:hypothetical protein